MEIAKQIKSSRGLTLIEKIIAANAIGLNSIDEVRPGNVIVLGVSWVLSSEAAWVGIDKTYSLVGRPAIHRKDRVWLAQDHTVDPRINSRPRVKKTIDLAAAAAKELDLVDYYGPNYTIMHTEFCRERAQPGQVIIGADSHTCSAGSLGALAMGLGAADVTIQMITGETWLNIPPVLRINFINQPPFGIGGKDTILYVLGQLKRNTVAAGRAVEFVGPGIKYLSSDARFAVSNMATEFGAIAGVFVPDEITATYIQRRKDPIHRNSTFYFRPDENAEYAESFTIDLSKVDSLVALYPSPDNVVSVSEVIGKSLDGCFIGACTTAEEDLILSALVLRQGFKNNLKPCPGGQRKVTPGSVPIINRLRKIGLLHWFEKAGFEIGAPGCSFCVGVAADIAGVGEVWLSSQNRNFPNRMGPGSYANLSSAATVAASSFSMTVTDPRSLLEGINKGEFDDLRQLWGEESVAVNYIDPVIQISQAVDGAEASILKAQSTELSRQSVATSVISGKCIIFGDNIDTDAIIPAQAILSPSDEAMGEHCFEHVRPGFHKFVRDQGLNIVIGGRAFGCGSSREEAPRALKGAGVKAVIAKSFAFIYSRNQPNLALLGIVITDEDFYVGLAEGALISINLEEKLVTRGDRHNTGLTTDFSFQLSPIEEALITGGGVAEIYKKYGAGLFRDMIQRRNLPSKTRNGTCGSGLQGNIPRTCGDELSLSGSKAEW